MSNRLLDNRSFNKLAVNRLEAQAIRSDNVQPSQPSYLFSVLLENGTFERNNTGGTLTFDIGTENNNVIQFSDRPFRQTQNISLTDFVDLFTLGGSNSFEEDPPNMVLVHNEEQRTYKMKLSSQSNNQVVFTLELLPGETHDLTTVTGRMSLFVDNVDTGSTGSTFTITKDSNDKTISFNGTYEEIIINNDVVNVTLENISTEQLTNNGNSITLSGEISIKTLNNNGILTLAGNFGIFTLRNNYNLTISGTGIINNFYNNNNFTTTVTGKDIRITDFYNFGNLRLAGNSIRITKFIDNNNSTTTVTGKDIIFTSATNNGTINVYNNSFKDY